MSRKRPRARNAISLGLVAGSEAATALAEMLGEDFNLAALDDDARIVAAGSRLAEVYLVLACQDGWSGIAAEDGTPIAAPDAATVALLLNDPRCRQAVLAVVNSTLHEAQAEKNGSAASPAGGAVIPAGAANAAPAAMPAPPAA